MVLKFGTMSADKISKPEIFHWPCNVVQDLDDVPDEFFN